MQEQQYHIQIVLRVDPNLLDQEDETGVTEAGFLAILSALAPFGDEIDIRRVEVGS